eukprot:c18690_g1_i1.p1 GENE.c18690_g1_i1~~c18690_g1_i1.p1  ORF type:complete len:900 (-),score=260.32 c18690_g1_i1:129-2828(-)
MGVAIDSRIMFGSWVAFVVLLSGCNAFQEFTAETKNAIMGSNTPVHLLVFVDHASEQDMEQGRALLTEADRLRSSSGMLHVLVPCNGAEGDTVKNYFKLESLPTALIVVTNQGMLRHPFEGDFNAANALVKFIDDFTNARTNPVVKSADKIENQQGAVYELVGSDFDEIVLDSSKDVLVFIYSPNCPHCKRYAPQYAEMAEQLTTPTFRFTKINALENSITHPRVRWTAFPTLYLFPRNFKHAPIRAQPVLIDEMRTFISSVLAQPNQQQQRQQQASQFRTSDLQFAKIFNAETSQSIFQSSIKTHYLFFIDTDSPDGGALMEAFDEVARHHNDDKVLHVIVPVNSDQGQGIVRFFQIPQQQNGAFVPTALITETHKAFKNFRFNGAPNRDSLNQFENNFRAGALRPTLKSQLPKEKFTEGALDLVGSEFIDYVMSNKKDALLFLYSPTCPVCLEFSPVFDALAQRLAPMADSLVVAKFDMTQNQLDHDMIELTGYPTLYFVPGDNKQHAILVTDRTEEGLVEFVSQHSTALSGGSASANGAPAARVVSARAVHNQHANDIPSVFQLDEGNFDKFTQANPSMMTAFFASWDKRSKVIPQAFLIVSQMSLIPFTSVDCAHSWNVCEEMGVVTYPAVAWVTNGGAKVDELKGEVTFDKMVDFTRSRAGHNAVLQLDDSDPYLAGAWCDLTHKRLNLGTDWMHKPPYHDLCADEHRKLSPKERSQYAPVRTPEDLGEHKYDYNLWMGAKRRTRAPESASGNAAAGGSGTGTSQADGGWEKFAKSVALITDENSWEEFREENARALVLFFAPWCEESAKLRPVLIEVQSNELLRKAAVTVAAVDCDRSWEICEKLDIMAYPTLMLFTKHGAPAVEVKPSVGASAKSLVAAIKSQLSLVVHDDL